MAFTSQSEPRISDAVQYIERMTLTNYPGSKRRRFPRGGSGVKVWLARSSTAIQPNSTNNTVNIYKSNGTAAPTPTGDTLDEVRFQWLMGNPAEEIEANKDLGVIQIDGVKRIFWADCNDPVQPAPLPPIQGGD